MAQSSSVAVGTPVTLTASVISGNNAQVTGQVMFCDAVSKNCAAGALGVAQLRPQVSNTQNSGVATFTFFPVAGSRNYTAIFLPNTSFSGSTSTPLTLNVTAAAATTTTMTSSGNAGNYSLTASVSSGGIPPATGAVTITNTTSGASLGTLTLGAPNASTAMRNTAKPSSGDSGPCTVASGDFNNDGIADFAIGVGCQAPGIPPSAAALQILIGKGDGTFTASATAPPFAQSFVNSIAVGDFNHDGNVDMVLDASILTGGTSFGNYTYSNGLYFLAGNGTGGFTSGKFGNGCGSYNMVAADFNSDGNLDFAEQCSNSDFTSMNTQVYNGNGTGGFGGGVNLAGGSYALNGLAVADFNGDGRSDLVVANPVYANNTSSLNVVVYVNNGSGGLNQSASFSIPGGLSVVAGDFNGDGKADVAFIVPVYSATSATQSTLIMGPGNGDGTFGAGVSTATTVFADSDGSSAVAMDFNKDGITDIGMVGNAQAQLMLGSSSGTFLPGGAATLENTGDPDYYPSAAGDFNKDGIPDFLVASSDLQYASAFAVSQTQSQTATLSPAVITGSGTQAITAAYAGDSTTAASTSTAVNLTGSKAATTLTVTAAPNQIASGAQVLLSASLTPYNSGSLTTDGETVTFYNGGTKLGTGTLTTGVATLNTTSITATTNSITASYAGDANFGGSNATATTVTVGSPSVSLSPAALVFPSTYKGSTSAAQTLTFINTTGAALPVVGVQTTGDFAQTNNCGTSLAVGASCTIQVTFTPTASDSRSGTATVQVTPSNQSATASLTGTGVVAPPTVAPGSLAFGNAVVGGAGTPQVVTVTMVATTNIASVSAPAGFSVLSSCAGAYVLGQSCKLTVNFIPTTAGAASGNVQVVYDAGTEIIPVTGTGTAPSVPTVSPFVLNFPPTTVGGTAPTQTFTITNTSTGPLALTSVIAETSTNSDDYTATYACSNTIPVGGSCLVTVTFHPTVTGAVSGVVVVNDNASTPRQSVTLNGIGAAAAPVLSPTSLNFANTTVGMTSAAQMMTFTNGTANAIPVSAVQATGDFAQTNNCGSSVAIGGNCTISVTFTPTASGQRSGALTVGLTPASLSPIATLTGTGIPVVPTVPALSPASLSFGSQTVGAATAAQTVTLKNTATVSLAVSSIAATGDFSQTNTCGSSVAAGASCTISVVYTPSAAGNATGTLTIIDNASTSTQTVALTGTGVAPTVGITPPTPPSGGTFTVGTSGSTTITIGITPPPAYTGGVLVTCKVILKGSGSAPNQPACKLTPSTVNVTNGSSGSTVLTVTTGTSTTGALEGFGGETGIALAGTVLVMAGSFKRKWRGALLAVLCTVMLGFAVGCGGGGSSSSTTSTTGTGTATTAGSYTITVAATAGDTTSSVDVPLTVQ